MALKRKWYESVLAMGVRRDLEKNAKVARLSSPYRERFISFAARQRVTFENDLNAEWQEFYEQFVAKRLYNINVKMWKQVRKRVFERDAYTCVYCGRIGGKLEIDHIIPISHGGTNEMANLATACRRCNRQKRDKSVKAFIEWRKRHE
ncbi:HNH endonuclease [Lacticaseibacillus paracasei]|uniref:HNH endonuclease n=1 Tax=Lacticaseibacillus paracasei TaxID=1597 RepID=UPI00336B3974